ncbi:MAG: response regulator, partial [Gemmataceae bacterium]|nr:response regulator [Gemmataceae bacterium]
ALGVARRRAEQQLQRAKEAAEAAARTQSQLLANMSHELRTPTAAVVGCAEMLLDPRLSAGERGRTLQTIMRSARHLSALISDVLDLSKIEAGQMALELTRCRLRRVVLDAVAQADLSAREKRLDLRLVPAGKLPALLTTDPTRLRQILDNLLSNAVKFTDPDKRVELRLRLDGPPGDGRLVVEVEDEGIGIAPDALGRLFQPFTQADPTTTRRYGGTGLGLSICKRLAELLGGQIAARSTPGIGSCFTLTLPVPAEDAADLVDAQGFAEDTHSRLLGTPPAVRLAGRVLLAEDTPTIQNIIRYFLERAGLTVEAVDNGRAAVERALAGGFDVVLMDMQMPE